MTLPNKARDFQHLILALRQRGMESMTTRKLVDGSFAVDLAYLSPGKPLQHHTVYGQTDVAVLENARDYLVEHGLPI